MYTNLVDALARAKERSGATTADDAYLTELLTLSSGKDASQVVHYRPFYCAAKWLEQNRGQQLLKKAKDGIEFTGLAKPIESLLALQAAYDSGQGLTVPVGFEAASLDCLQCAAVAPVSMRRFGTRSQATRIQP